MCEFLRKLLNADDTSPTAAEERLGVLRHARFIFLTLWQAIENRGCYHGAPSLDRPEWLKRVGDRTQWEGTLAEGSSSVAGFVGPTELLASLDAIEDWCRAQLEVLVAPGTPCPQCGGPRVIADQDRLCGSCRSPDGKLVELWVETHEPHVAGHSYPSKGIKGVPDRIVSSPAWMAVAYWSAILFEQGLRERFAEDPAETLAGWLHTSHGRTRKRRFGRRSSRSPTCSKKRRKRRASETRTDRPNGLSLIEASRERWQ